LGCQRRIALDESILRDLYFGGVIECEGCGYKTLLTGNSEFLLMAHLAQDKVSCPSCDVIVSASKENLASFKEGKIICQECGVEISIEI
jgi:DNA-directed RNA polymerase subunit RPC12/RpoP